MEHDQQKEAILERAYAYMDDIDAQVWHLMWIANCYLLMHISLGGCEIVRVIPHGAFRTKIREQDDVGNAVKFVLDRIFLNEVV